MDLGLENINLYSSESLDITVDGKEVTVYKKEAFAKDEDIKKAEDRLNFKFGPQTKELFKKYAGLYYGTVEFNDLDKAVKLTQAHYKDDDRLQGKPIDKLFVASYGNGDCVVVDSSDKVYDYVHDANPVFTDANKLMKGKNLKQYIKADYEAYKEYKNQKDSKSVEELYGQLIELNELESQITSDIKLYNTLDSISSCIKKYGVTESINFMYGENFSSAASMEAEVEEHKSSLLKKIIDSICKFIRKVVNFFKDTFNGRKRMIEKLKEIRDHADEYQLPITTIAGRINNVVVAKTTDWNAIAKEVADAQKKVIESKPLETPKNIVSYNELMVVVSKMHIKLLGKEPITISTPNDLKDCCSAIISWLEKLNSISSIEVDDLLRSVNKFERVENDKDGTSSFSSSAYEDALANPDYHKAFVRYVQVAAGKIDLSESLKCVRDLISKLKKKSSTEEK